jgi:hypothetical protein
MVGYQGSLEPIIVLKWALMMAGGNEHLGIEGTCPSFCKIRDVEPVRSKRLDYGLVDALVGNWSYF